MIAWGAWKLPALLAGFRSFGKFLGATPLESFRRVLKPKFYTSHPEAPLTLQPEALKPTAIEVLV